MTKEARKNQKDGRGEALSMPTDPRTHMPLVSAGFNPILYVFCGKRHKGIPHVLFSNCLSFSTGSTCIQLTCSKAARIVVTADEDALATEPYCHLRPARRLGTDRSTSSTPQPSSSSSPASQYPRDEITACCHPSYKLQSKSSTPVIRQPARRAPNPHISPPRHRYQASTRAIDLDNSIFVAIPDI
ncbi:uncharacterized protein FOMMEDRAFT_162541 [Fomitiporia mediterranea MF3/22]|uniref:Uncharacterized protein n=1 Tax=Fomitiporia mediterranea (strain MF3/22) TaxID=694068 RepID=R7SGC2_FOMME|nr:uncharacterized protein FOMMEDRAFT_162541 [Fomitiporia mediterranea MF3/22]EJC97733.1 hypothetical protein FOMMEDRAFT_162541 [Fomitiporia mediterranea MF3/22]